jgi:hypothetical protein
MLFSCKKGSVLFKFCSVPHIPKRMVFITRLTQFNLCFKSTRNLPDSYPSTHVIYKLERQDQTRGICAESLLKGHDLFNVNLCEKIIYVGTNNKQIIKDVFIYQTYLVHLF